MLQPFILNSIYNFFWGLGSAFSLESDIYSQFFWTDSFSGSIEVILYDQICNVH